MSEIDSLKTKIQDLENKIEFLFKRFSITYGDDSSPVVDHRIIEQLRKGNKIEAIKIHREIFNSSLLDAKNAVEKIADEINRFP